jgi:hypothetical protein
MKFMCLISLAILAGCSQILPLFIEDVKEVIEFEEDAVRDEIQIRESHHNM